MKNIRPNVHQVLGILACLLLSSCNFIGPAVLPQDRQGYNRALKNTDEQQILLNLVRMKYGDRPFFLSVSSITAATTFSRGFTSNFEVDNTRQRFYNGATNNPFRIFFKSAAISPAVNYSETPAVTYTPLQGTLFTQQMLSPISLSNVALLVNSGWSVARVLRITVQSIGNLKNAPGSTRPNTSHIPEYKAFTNFAHLMRKNERENFLRVHSAAHIKGQPYRLEVSLVKKNNNGIQNMRTLEKMLGFSDFHDHFYILQSDSGYVDEAKRTVGIQMRSYLGLLYYLSKAVAVRQQDIDNRIVVVPRDAKGRYFNWRDMTKGMMEVDMSLQRPRCNVTVLVRYRGMWFYIKDSDNDSKETLSLLEQLFSLQAGNMGGNPLNLTLQV